MWKTIIRLPGLSFSYILLLYLPTCLFTKAKLKMGLHNRWEYLTFILAPHARCVMFLIFWNDKLDLSWTVLYFFLNVLSFHREIWGIFLHLSLHMQPFCHCCQNWHSSHIMLKWPEMKIHLVFRKAWACYPACDRFGNMWFHRDHSLFVD